MADKKYLSGNGKEVVFEDGGSVINVYIDLDDAKEKGFIFKNKDGRNAIAFTVAKKREVGRYGDTHYLYQNDRSSGPSSKPAPMKPAPIKQAKETQSKPSDDLPF